MTVTYSAPIAVSRKKSRNVLLPLLIVLFLISYAILTMLVVEQGRTIESQRILLREMLKDSTQLAELKARMTREERHILPPAPAEQKDPAAGKAPAGNAATKNGKRSAKSQGSVTIVPEKPEADLEDVRRSTHTL